MPITPKEQLIGVQNDGMQRSGPNISASGMTSAHVITPNSTTHLYLQGGTRPACP